MSQKSSYERLAWFISQLNTRKRLVKHGMVLGSQQLLCTVKFVVSGKYKCALTTSILRSSLSASPTTNSICAKASSRQLGGEKLGLRPLVDVWEFQLHRC